MLLEWCLGYPDRMSAAQRRAIAGATAETPLWVSDISFWEIATLMSRGRLRIDMPLRDWLEQATAEPLVQRARITPAVAAEVAQLPDTFHRDPADRVLVATARVLGATLVTRDRRIVAAQLIPTLR